MTTQLSDLITAQTSDEILADELATAQANGLQTTTWQVGSVIRTILVIVANALAAFSQIIVEPIKGGFGDLLSSLAWATLWAKQTYNVDAIVAQPATGTVDFTNATGKTYTWNPGDIIVAHSVTGKLYRNTLTTTILPSATTANVPIASVEVGTANNAVPDTITVLVGPSMSGVTVNNPQAVLGADDETVAALVPRARESLGALSPHGPKDAYNFVAKTPSYSATSSPITRTSTYGDPSTGLVSVYLATATGAPTPADIAVVQLAIEKWSEPWGVNSTAVPATNVVVNISYTVWVSSGLSAAVISTAINNALAAYFASIPIGGTVTAPATGQLYFDALVVVIATAQTASGQSLGIVRADLNVPASNVALTPSQVAVLGTITSTVNFL